jgi:hypothetical protein
VLQQTGRVELSAVQRYDHQQVIKTDPFESPLMVGFSHPCVQEALYTWAGSCGATMLRPAKAISFALNGQPTVTVVADGGEDDAVLLHRHLAPRRHSVTSEDPITQHDAAGPEMMSAVGEA